MAGHNKWSQIKHKKAKEDSKRGKAFTKLTKEISVAAREGGGDLEANARLRQLVDKAKYINMPQENIVRAIKRGTGEMPGVHYEPYTYEGYGPFGIAIVIETLSDNKNRTVADLRHIFLKGNGTLGESGSVSWMFKKMGVVRGTSNKSEDDLIEALLEYDITDIKQDGTFFSIFCNPKSLAEVKKAAQATSMKIDNAELEWVAQTTTELTDVQTAKAVDLLSTLQDHDDVQNVYTNLA
ncbi:YebC/PmpR family DNA-binding transcriptional regulator [Candidatus Dependentiae bacterium]|nr:MAG: YebC/PmpR family DNA-binding transcriptional regulator [Candidatus Dependentiae bacterium]